MSLEESRLMALDVGEARIGLALSDPLGVTAQPIEPLRRTFPRDDLRRLAELVAEHGVVKVVVGNPLRLSGEEGSASEVVRGLARRLQGRVQPVPVVLWDERLTTVQAERDMVTGNVRRKRRRELVDSIAAALILQSFLDAGSPAGTLP